MPHVNYKDIGIYVNYKCEFDTRMFNDIIKNMYTTIVCEVLDKENLEHYNK